jgi:hypothetical protein
MVTFRVFPGPILDIGDHLPPSGPSRTPTDTCIPFAFNAPVTYRSRRCSTASLLSPFLSLRCGLAPLQRTGTPPPSILFPVPLPRVRSASARIALFCAITPLLPTLAYFMGGGGSVFLTVWCVGIKGLIQSSLFLRLVILGLSTAVRAQIATKPLRFCNIQWRTDQG